MKLLIALLLVSGPVLADEAAFFRCRDISDDSKRLACYDAVKKPTAAQKRELQEQAFGLAPKRPEIETIQSHIPGGFEGWQAEQRIRLANGQVWQVVDDSEGVVIGKDLKATVARGAMGAMYMEIDGARKSPRVKRVK
ncbi:hypothetical protein ACFSQU_03890 [Massilia sp. GCM10020059]|uniref:Uncharacterized protein n=1 Tax=Massilia agrisoli TaxID=2892444 RepID=A0ABS8IPE6_9BURK|nr:hypothetical protein [Massilia agrisoli]MCC6070058.1 hypothetical protein [Massilia agrisoli]